MAGHHLLFMLPSDMCVISWRPLNAMDFLSRAQLDYAYLIMSYRPDCKGEITSYQEYGKTMPHS